MLHVSPSVLHQACGSSRTVPDDWAVADLLNHSTHCVEIWFRHPSGFDQNPNTQFREKFFVHLFFLRLVLQRRVSVASLV